MADESSMSGSTGWLSPGRLVSLVVILLLPSVLSVSSCGFQLRGAIEASPDISPVYLQTSSAYELAREIRQVMRANGIGITDERSEARSELVLQAEKKRRRVLSVDSDGRAREYLLFYDVDLLVRSRLSGTEKFSEASETISLTRTLLFDQSAVLAVSNESSIIYDDMRKQAARLILLKLQAQSTGDQG